MKKFILLFLSITILVGCKKTSSHLTEIRGSKIPINESITKKKEVVDYIEPYKNSVEKEMKSPLIFAPKNLVRTDGDLESSLGNLLADLSFEQANPIFHSRSSNAIDFAMFNYGGIRAEIHKGVVTNEHAFNLMPFENEFVVVELTAEKVLELINFLITNKKAHPISKELRISLDSEKFNIQIKGQPLNQNSTYFVLTSDYLQSGGDNMVFFNNPVSLTKLDYKVRNAMIDYFKKVDTLKVVLDGRFKRN